jgi:hypothetical protein
MFTPLVRGLRPLPHRAGRGRRQEQRRRAGLRLEKLEDRCLLAVDPILEWNAVALQVNQTSYSGFDSNDQSGPTRSSRALAIESVAMFDAWNSIHRTYTPYLTQAPNATNASDVAAVAQAAHDTLDALYPHQQALIDTAFTQTLQRLANTDTPTRVQRGRDVGAYVAQQILLARTDDGSQVDGQYVPDGLAGHHQPDPNNPTQGFLTPAWGDVTPFGLVDWRTQIPTPTVPYIIGDPNLTDQPQEYQDAFAQVRALGEDLGSDTQRTTDQTEIGIFWGYDVAHGLGDPPRLFNQIARVIAVQQNNTVGENARMFALLNIALADAGIQCWGVKYRDAFWRPIVAIRDTPTDQGGDPDWDPLGAPRTNPFPGEINFTPPFPSYTSGHADFAGAAFKTLADFYQTDDINFSIPFTFISDEFNGVSRDVHDAIPPIILNSVRGIEPRHYNSFSQAAAECAASRIFLGIHWRFDAIQGVSAGDRIADIDFDTKLRPRHGGPQHVASVDFTSQIDAYLNNTYTDYFPGSGPASAGTGNGQQPAETANQRYVAQVYEDVLGRPADPIGMAYWSGQLDQGTPASQVASGITGSPEYHALQLQNLYAQLLHRSVDATGMGAFMAVMSEGATMEQVTAAIEGSAEYFQTRGGGTNTGFLSALYQDQLGRAVDPTGQAVFTQALAGGVSRGQVAMTVLTSDEGRGDLVGGFYQGFLQRDADSMGMSAFLTAMRQGLNDDQLIATLLGSAEYRNNL